MNLIMFSQTFYSCYKNLIRSFKLTVRTRKIQATSLILNGKQPKALTLKNRKCYGISLANLPTIKCKIANLYCPMPINILILKVIKSVKFKRTTILIKRYCHVICGSFKFQKY